MRADDLKSIVYILMCTTLTLSITISLVVVSCGPILVFLNTDGRMVAYRKITINKSCNTFFEKQQHTVPKFNQNRRPHKIQTLNAMPGSMSLSAVQGKIQYLRIRQKLLVFEG